jgi:hypothetical protein
MRLTTAVMIILVSVASAADAEGRLEMEVGPNSPDGERIDAKEISAGASTTLCEKKSKTCHGPEQLLDDNLATAWCEGLPGDGTGAVLTFTFAHPQAVTGIGIVPHFAKSFALAEQNNQLAKIDVATDGGTFSADLSDWIAEVRKRNGAKPYAGDDGCGDETCMSRDERIKSGVSDYIRWGHQPKNPADFFKSVPIKTSKLVITLRGVYKGTKYPDTCASEVMIYRAK